MVLLKTETTDHYLLRCAIFSDLRELNQSLKNFSDEELVNVLLYGSEKFTFSTNTKIQRHAIKFLKATERFDSFLF